MMEKLLIRGGRVIDPANGMDKIADVLIEDGKIAAIGEGLSADGAKVYDAAGKVVVPGFIDMHCHLRDPGQEYKEDILVGYRWYDTKKIKPLFPFGYGLSYTTFQYDKPVLSAKKVSMGDGLSVSVKVKNTGTMAGKEAVQLYIGDEKCSLLRPQKELKGFKKISLQPGEEKVVTFDIKPEDLQFFDDSKHEWVAEPGKFKVYVTSSSANVDNVAEFMCVE